MNLNIDEQEKELLIDLLTTEHKSLLDELLHTESYDYRQLLKQKDELLKNLRSKIQNAAQSA